jgi:hypothetical protein
MHFVGGEHYVRCLLVGARGVLVHTNRRDRSVRRMCVEQ